MNTDTPFTPSLLGLTNPKFASWREDQYEAARRIVDTDKRFIALSLPTGKGKSLAYMAAALLMPPGTRATILTGTKALQDQLESDFGSLPGFHDLRGKSNYECLAFSSPKRRVTCDRGPCFDGHPCELKAAGCDYFEAIEAAALSAQVSTNYAAMIAHQRYRPGWRTPDLLIADEAHELEGWVRRSLTHSISRETLDETAKYTAVSLPFSDTKEAWRTWALKVLDRLVGVDPRDPSYETLQSCQRFCLSLKGSGADERLHQYPDGRLTLFPVRVIDAINRILWGAVPEGGKIVLSSATLARGMVERLGIPAGDVEWIESSHPVPAARRPAYILKTGVRLSFRSTQRDTRLWMQVMDRLIQPRGAGIIHTVSYKRAEQIKSLSRWGKRILTHTSRTTKEAVARFRRAGRGLEAGSTTLILASPVVTTGWDFPGDECRFQILAKVPFPDTRDPVEKVVLQENPRLSEQMTAVTITQTYGRAVRTPDDWAEFFIVDDQIRWFLTRNKDLFPQWFLDSVIWSDDPPRPLNKEG